MIRHKSALTLLSAVVALVWGSLGLLPVEPVRAAEPQALDTSVQWLPEDAAFYCAMLRNREQVEIIAESKAWAKIKAMPVIQEGWTKYEEEADKEGSNAARVKAAQKNPQVVAALETLADMLGEEIFLYGGGDYVDVLDLVQEVYSTVQYGAMLEDMSEGGGSVQEAQARMALSTAVENLEAIKIPTTMLGFKVEDTERTEKQLDALAGLLTLGCMMVPQLNNRFARAQVGDYEFLTLSFDGEMIPWDEVPVDDLREIEANEGDADKLIARLKELTLVVAIGLRDNYLLVCTAESTDAVAELGAGPALIDRPEFEPLKKHGGKRICGMGYLSEAMHLQLASNERDIDSLLALLDAALPRAELSEEEQSRIHKDADALAAELKEVLPEPGALMSFSFLTSQGVEGYSYNWGEHLFLDGSKKLDLLQHTGGNPLLAAVWRETHRPDVYDGLVKWLQVGYGYFEKYGLPEMSRHDREQFQSFMDRAMPLLKRANKANRELLMPALADSQGGFILDGKLKVRQLCREAPPLDGPMPMLEPAMVVGVSDADLLRKACSEYREIFNGLARALHEVEPNDVPEFELPEPKIKTTPAGDLFMYPLPEEWGVDQKIVPNFGLSDRVGVVSISRQHTQRLLRETPLQTGGVLADGERPRAVGVAFDWAGVVDAVTPWVDFAAEKIMKEQMDLDEDAPEEVKAQAAAIMDQVHTVLEVLKVIRTCTVESYFEGEALVSHSLTEIRDIE
jgi:hypothetical protein